MEKSHKELLDEMSSLLASLKEGVSALERKLSELQSSSFVYDMNDIFNDAEALSDGTAEAESAVSVEPAAASAAAAAEAESAEAESVAAESAEPSAAAGPDGQNEDDMPEEIFESEEIFPESQDIFQGGADDSGPEALSGSRQSQEAEAPAEPVSPTVKDRLSEKEAWRKDMPGQPVKDVRSAVSLNDRALFIHTIFREDPLLFSRTVTEINAMDTLEQVVDYLSANFPEWDMDSDLVYRFMMAVRRKVR